MFGLTVYIIPVKHLQSSDDSAGVGAGGVCKTSTEPQTATQKENNKLD